MTIEKFASLDIKCLHTIKYALQHIDHALQQLNQTNKYALQNRLLIIGEAVNNLSKDFKSEFTKMPWDVLSKIRTDTSHWFFCLDISLLMTCIKQDIAVLIKIVDDIEADSSSAKTEPVSVALEKVVKDTEKKRRAYEQKRSRRKGEVYEDVYAIQFLSRILDELNNIDKFIKNPDKNIPNLTRYALEMVLIIISLCIKKHVPEKLLLEYPLNLTISSVGNQSITMSLTWSYLKAVKKRFMHHSHTFNNDSVKRTALSVTEMKTQINTMLLAIQQQYPQRLVKEYFSYSIKNMLSGISGFAQEFPRPWPEVWRMHLNTDDLFKELNNERALHMKTEKQYANTATLITSFFCPPSQWLVFIIKPS